MNIYKVKTFNRRMDELKKILQEEIFLAEEVDSTEILPSPSEESRGKLAVILGGEGVADTVYICLKNTNNKCLWNTIAGYTEISNISSLSDIKVDGVSIEGFDDEVLEYAIELETGTTTVPTVTATETDSDSTTVVTPTEDLPGTTIITVTSEDKTSVMVYSVVFTVAEEEE